MAATSAERQAARLARYRTMKFTLETIRRECPDAATRRLADEALSSGQRQPISPPLSKREPSKAERDGQDETAMYFGDDA
jgi:hypothetical protein